MSRTLRLLLVHQNFPGQFRQLVPALLERGDELVALCSHQRPLPEHPRLRVLRYTAPELPAGIHLPNGSALWHEALERAQCVGRAAQRLLGEGWIPDAICGHSGWGETLGLRPIWPAAPQIIWPELWLGQGDPEQALAQLGRNSLTRAALSQADAWVLPTDYQAQSFPTTFQGAGMHVIHEGIDTDLAQPNAAVTFEVRGIRIDRSVPTVTFVNRNLEAMRGFDQFMRAVVDIQRQHPTVRVLIVGDNKSGYGGHHPSGRPWREVMLEELGPQLDLERLHFLGRIPHPQLIALLQASWVHVYLSQPFILGWSLLEAMACGCCIVGSSGIPVDEVIRHGENGLLVPLGSPDVLAQRVLQLLGNPHARHLLGSQARQDALAWDQRQTLPQLLGLIDQTAQQAAHQLRTTR